jgi:hypothetical protein
MILKNAKNLDLSWVNFIPLKDAFRVAPISSVRTERSFYFLAMGSRYPLGRRLRVDSHYTALHNTTRQKPACIHIYRQLADTTCSDRHRQAKYCLLPIQATLSLSLVVGDGLMWIRASENHKRIFCRVVLCNVNRLLLGPRTGLDAVATRQITVLEDSSQGNSIVKPVA